MTPHFEDILRGSALARFVPPERYARLRALFTEHTYDFGEVIVRQGEEADAYYLLVSGRLRVLREAADGTETAVNRLVPGDEFGESALSEGGTRGATVRASTRVELLRLGRDDFLALAGEFPEIRPALELVARWRTLHGFLHERSHLGRLSAPALRALIHALEPQRVAKGTPLIVEGEPAGPMYIVRHGRACAFTGHGAARRNLAYYRDGDYFGELSVLSDAPRAASVEAVSDCELLALAPAALRELRTKFADLEQLLQERLAQYRHREEARVPLDFAEELLPSAPKEVPEAPALDPAAADDDEPFVENGYFRRRTGRIRRFPWVAQIDAMDCGAACLAMVCRHFGREVGLPRIRALCHTGTDGTSLRGICAAATELGLAARALKVSSSHLDQLPLPAVCHWEGNHWIVLYRVDATHVRVADPGRGRRKLTREAFLAGWSGYAALFDFTDAFRSAPEDRVSLGWLRSFVRGHRGSLLQGAALAALVSGLTLLFPVFTQFVVDRVIVEHDPGQLGLVLGAMVAILAFLLSANLIQQYLFSFVAVRVDAAILDFLTRRLLALPMSYFHSRRTGDIQRRLDGARQVRQFVVQQGVGGLLALLQLAACLALMAVYSPVLAGTFLCTLPLYGGLMVYSRVVLRPVFSDLEEAYARYASHQIDAIRGIEAVKAAGAELSFRDQMLAQFLRVSRQQFRGNFMMMAYESLLHAVSHGSTILFLWIGARQVMGGQLSVGAFVAFSSLIALAGTAILRALGSWDDLQMVSVLLNRLNDVFAHEPEQGSDRARLRAVPALSGHLVLNHVGFRYGGPEAPAILDDISLEVPAGRTFALVGRSGSGKTTLVKMIAGLMQPTSGNILFDRMDSRALNHRELRRHIGFVLQENHLFDDTIIRNIAFGDPEPNLDRVVRAAQLANAHEFIQRLPLGYETRIGETGLALSGGQRQRIAIARALYPEPAILIFDEATSALDTESERAIQGNLAQLTRGRTCLIIAHRLSTIRDADRIVVLEQGRIAEIGTHDELMARRGLYFYLSSQQLGLS